MANHYQTFGVSHPLPLPEAPPGADLYLATAETGLVPEVFLRFLAAAASRCDQTHHEEIYLRRDALRALRSMGLPDTVPSAAAEALVTAVIARFWPGILRGAMYVHADYEAFGVYMRYVYRPPASV